MLLDNAQLISVHSGAEFVDKDTKNTCLVQQTIDYWLALNKKNHHLFPASIDADNKDGEGAYYVFKESEIAFPIPRDPPKTTALVI